MLMNPYDSIHCATESNPLTDSPLSVRKKGRTLPTWKCFNIFDVDIFTRFVFARKFLDFMFGKLPENYWMLNIHKQEKELHRLVDRVKYENELFFENPHMLAYLAYKLSIYTAKPHIRERVIKGANSKYQIKKRYSVQNLKSWGKIINHDSDLQWLGGTDHSQLSTNTIVSLKKNLTRHNIRGLLKKVVIDGVKYSIVKPKEELHR
jgi:hypothetical protein